MYTRALLTDLYELTMAAGYFDQGKVDDTATFDLYFRHNPFNGGYAIAAGLQNGIQDVIGAGFSPDDLQFLGTLTASSGSPLFPKKFLEYLASYRFHGNIQAIPEGTVVFPNEPLLQVSGRLIDCQIVETLLLCHINFQTLIATKAARIWEAANQGVIVDFGLRRAQGPDGGLSASRASFIGGAAGTSNVLAAALFRIPAKGTHAHSWIQSFPSELEAFRSYARSFPDDSILLVDTFDTLQSGVPNAIRIAKELERDGHRLAGIRIDSGDLTFLSQQARRMLDREGLAYVKIVASSELDEYLISDILSQGGRIDLWGVGTHLVAGTGDGGGALGGVYKMVEHNGQPKIKLSANPEKITNPGAKKVVRFYNQEGLMEADAVAANSEDLHTSEVLIVDPGNPLRRKQLNSDRRVELLRPIVLEGNLIYDFPSLDQIRDYRKDQLATLHESHKRLYNPHEYKVGLTQRLWQQKEQMISDLETGHQ